MHSAEFITNLISSPKNFPCTVFSKTSSLATPGLILLIAVPAGVTVLIAVQESNLCAEVIGRGSERLQVQSFISSVSPAGGGGIQDFFQRAH